MNLFIGDIATSAENRGPLLKFSCSNLQEYVEPSQVIRVFHMFQGTIPRPGFIFLLLFSVWSIW